MQRCRHCVTPKGNATPLIQLDRSILDHVQRYWCPGCGTVRDYWKTGEKEHTTTLFRAVGKHPEAGNLLGADFRTRTEGVEDVRDDDDRPGPDDQAGEGGG